MKIEIKKLLVSANNTRQPDPKDPAIQELARSLKSIGQTSNLLVRPHPKKAGHYEIAAGARRRCAAEVAGIKHLEAEVRKMTDDDFETAILVDNLQRENPDPKAEAQLLVRLSERGKTTVAEIAAAMGKPDTWVSRRMRLLHVDPKVLKMWSSRMDHFTVEMMELMGSIPAAAQIELSNSYHVNRVRTRAELEKSMQEFTCRLDTAPFDLADPKFFVKGCGPGCASSSEASPGLFDFKDEKKKKDCARCLNPSCFNKRIALWRNAEYERVTKGEKLDVVAEADITLKGHEYHRDYYGTAHQLKAKPSEGAKKVLHVQRDGSLRIAWLPKEKKSPGQPDRADRSPEEKQADKINALQGKRWLYVRERLFAAFEKAKLADLTVPIDSLIAIFGLPFREESTNWKPADAGLWDYIFHTDGKFPTMKRRSFAWSPDPDEDEEIERNEEEPTDFRTPGRYDARGTFDHGEPDTTREDALWPAVRHVLLGLIVEPNKICDAPKWEPHYKSIAKLIKFPILSTKMEADLAILPPKSWGKVDPHTLEPMPATPPPPKVDLADQPLEALNDQLEAAIKAKKKTAYNKARAEIHRRYGEHPKGTFTPIPKYEEANNPL